MAFERTKNVAKNALRVKRIVRGAVKELVLPENVVMVVHKPGYAQYRPLVEEVYARYGITPLSISRKRFSEKAVRENYEGSFRKWGEAIKKSIIENYRAHGLFDRNIAIELVHVPQSALKETGSANAWEAMKKIAGRTKLGQAAEEMITSGLPSIRGHVFLEAARRGLLTPEEPNTIVHVPDPERVTYESKYLGGRWTDLDLFVNSFDVAKALYAWKKKFGA